MDPFLSHAPLKIDIHRIKERKTKGGGRIQAKR